MLVGLGLDFNNNAGPQISLFDIKDLSNPRLVDQQTIPAGCSGWLGTFSDHHVVAYYADQGVLTVSVPVVSQQAGGNWSEPNDLYVFHVDTTGATPGLTLLGQIAHDDSVLRSVEVGDRLISISQESIEIHDFTDPAVVIASLTVNAPLPTDDEIPSTPVIYPVGIELPIEIGQISLPEVGDVEPLIAISAPVATTVPPTTLATPVGTADAAQPGKTTSSPAASNFPAGKVAAWTIQTFVGPHVGASR